MGTKLTSGELKTALDRFLGGDGLVDVSRDTPASCLSGFIVHPKFAGMEIFARQKWVQDGLTQELGTQAREVGSLFYLSPIEYEETFGEQFDGGLEQRLSVAKPLPIEDALASGENQAWAVWEPGHKRHLIVPHQDYPGRRPIHLFRTRQDASLFIKEVGKAQPSLKSVGLIPIQVPLQETWHQVAQGKLSGADGLVLHSVSEVVHWAEEIALSKTPLANSPVRR